MLQWEKLNNSNIHKISVIESTNSLALDLVKQGKGVHGKLIWTDAQTGGRGQRANTWSSALHKDIALSLMLQHQHSDALGLGLLNMAVSLATRSFLQSFHSETFNVKWANDIYFVDRKVAGILIENSWLGSQWQYSIIGIGININSNWSNKDLNAISLSSITNQHYELEHLVLHLSQNLNFYLNKVMEQPQAILSDYNSFLYKRNQIVPFLHEGIVKDCLINEVLENGELSLTINDAPMTFAYGAIKQII